MICNNEWIVSLIAKKKNHFYFFLQYISEAVLSHFYMNRRRELNLNSYFDQSVFFNRSIHTFTAAQDVNVFATSANQGRTVPLASGAATLWYPGSSKSTLCQELMETNCCLSGWWLSKHFHLNEEAAFVGWRVGKLQAVSHANPGHQLVMAWVSVFDRKCLSGHWGWGGGSTSRHWFR